MHSHVATINTAASLIGTVLSLLLPWLATSSDATFTAHTSCCAMSGLLLCNRMLAFDLVVRLLCVLRSTTTARLCSARARCQSVCTGSERSGSSRRSSLPSPSYAKTRSSRMPLLNVHLMLSLPLTGSPHSLSKPGSGTSSRMWFAVSSMRHTSIGSTICAHGMIDSLKLHDMQCVTSNATRGLYAKVRRCAPQSPPCRIRRIDASIRAPTYTLFETLYRTVKYIRSVTRIALHMPRTTFTG